MSMSPTQIYLAGAVISFALNLFIFTNVAISAADTKDYSIFLLVCSVLVISTMLALCWPLWAAVLILVCVAGFTTL